MIALGSFGCALPVPLAYRLSFGLANLTLSMAAAKGCCAWATNGVWNAPETGKAIALKPSSAVIACAAKVHDAVGPAITSWVGAL